MLEIDGGEIVPKAECITSEFIEKWRKAGLSVRACGVSGVALMKKLCILGVDRMTVNFPNRLCRYINSL